MIYSVKNETFQVKKGPIFANFVLADEINRAPAKVQSALLEAMQERQVTIGDHTFALDKPFLVMATQNPIEQEGTYPLPEAQVDRFLMKVVIGYPTKDEEREIIRMNIARESRPVVPVLRPEEVIEAQKVVEQIYVDEKIERYIVDIVFATRTPKEYGLDDLADFISFGASPRASISLARAARAYAFLHQRGYVIPEDVISVAHDVLRHRTGQLAPLHRPDYPRRLRQCVRAGVRLRLGRHRLMARDVQGNGEGCRRQCRAIDFVVLWELRMLPR